ncbi:MAG: nickel-dependent lactate racemase [Candidatus Bathyarchaeia archaeon]
MQIKIPYGKGEVEFDIDDRRVLGVITPAEIQPAIDYSLEIERSLKNPIEGPTVEDLSPRGKTVAIAVDDLTRVTPTHLILPKILDSLEKAGAKRRDIKIIIALGTHREMTAQEMREKYGATVVEEYEVVNHTFDDESNLEYLGKIAGDVPVWINKEYLKADIRIVTGNIIPHFNAGWAAGAKILLPGLAGEETVGRMHVHSSLTTPNGLGMDENPTRQLIDAFAEKVGIHLLVNTVITRNREIVRVYTGHFMKAHRQGVEFAKRIYGVKAPGLAEISISSSYPADIEFWQGQKALFPADLATKPGGGIIEVTPCPEGISVMHPKWIDYLHCNTEELKRMYERGEVEDLVALGLAMNYTSIKDKHPICLVSEGISYRDAEKIGCQKFRRVEEALEYLTERYGSDSKVNILTHGGETYPIVS